MKAGDLVNWKHDYCSQNPGLLIKVEKQQQWVELQAFVLWAGGRITKQSIKNLEVFSESR